VDAEWRDLGAQRFHPSLEAELRCRVGGTELKAGDARARRDRDDLARALFAHDREDRARDVHGAKKGCRQLLLDLLGRQLFEVAGLEVARIIDQHVDAAEAVERNPNDRLRIGAVRDVQLDDQQIVRRTQGLGDGAGVPPGRHDRVAGGEGGLGDIDSHAAAGSLLSAIDPFL
jgi:hypothetical protein